MWQPMYEFNTSNIATKRGDLIRRFTKDNSLTSIDWNLKNQYGIPIASGAYIVHIDAPGIGEKVVKWFGALRPVADGAYERLVADHDDHFHLSANTGCYE
ncbi:MAG: hypothetical protein WC865_12480 [Bacteroidales bacterium]